MSRTKFNYKQCYIWLIVLLLFVLSLLSWLDFAKTIGKSNQDKADVSQNVQSANAQSDNTGAAVVDSDIDVDDVDDNDNIDVLRKIADRFDTVISKVESKWSVHKQEEFTKIDSLFTYLVSKEIASVQVVKGENGWLFYKTKSDGNPIADYEGTNSFSEKDMEQIAKSALEVQDSLGAMDCEVAILFPTNKENVYYNYMPRTYTHAEKSRTDLLVEYLIDRGVNAVSPKAALLSASNDQQLYYSYDTHWNQLGAYIGVKETLAEWGIRIPDLSERNIISTPLKDHYHYTGDDDLAKMAELPSFFSDDIEYTVEGTAPMDWETFDTEQDNSIVSHFHNDASANDKRLFLIGDSFRASMIPSLSEQFSDVYVVHRTYFETSMITETRPDYVIFEYVERYSYEIKNIGKLFN